MSENYTQDFIKNVKGSLSGGGSSCTCEKATNEDIEAIIAGTYVESEEESNG